MMTGLKVDYYAHFDIDYFGYCKTHMNNFT